jgi:hypothetical protein
VARAVTLGLVLGAVLGLGPPGCARRPAPAPPTPAPRAPAPPPVAPARESCGNCADDDGDGLVDFEDPDCCPRPLGLDGAVIALDAPRFTVSARMPAAGAAETTPLVDDVTIQLRSGHSELLCARLGHQYWVATGRTFRFRMRGGRRANAAPDALLRVLPDGTVAVRATGQRAGLDRVTDGDWRIAVRIGERCGIGSVRPTGRTR